MANISRKKQTGKKPTSSGHGALGMGGQPVDNPRDEAGGHEELPRDDRTKPVAGAFGSREDERTGNKTPDEVVGTPDDKTADELTK